MKNARYLPVSLLGGFLTVMLGAMPLNGYIGSWFAPLEYNQEAVNGSVGYLLLGLVPWLLGIYLIVYSGARPRDVLLLYLAGLGGGYLLAVTVAISEIRGSGFARWAVIATLGVVCAVMLRPLTNLLHKHLSGRRWLARSLLAILVGVAVSAAAYGGFQWWQRLPPSSSGAWGNEVFKSPGSRETAVPQFQIGGFYRKDSPTEIAFFVRIAAPHQLADPIPWYVEDNGRVFTDGRLVLPEAGRLRLFVGDTYRDPQAVVLDENDAKTFLGLEHSLTYERAVSFWNDVLRKKYLPELTEQREPSDVSGR